MKKATQIFLYIFHPLLLTTYLTTILSLYIPQYLMLPSSSVRTFIALIFIMTFVFPLSNILIFRAFDVKGNYQLKKRQNKILIIAMTNAIYLVISVLFIFKVQIGFGRIISIVTLLGLSATALWLLAGISFQALITAGFFGIITAVEVTFEGLQLLWPIIIFALILGGVLSAILYLNKNSLKQAVLGSIIGYSIGFLGIII